MKLLSTHSEPCLIVIVWSALTVTSHFWLGVDGAVVGVSLGWLPLGLICRQRVRPR